MHFVAFQLIILIIIIMIYVFVAVWFIVIIVLDFIVALLDFSICRVVKMKHFYFCINLRNSLFGLLFIFSQCVCCVCLS